MTAVGEERKERKKDRERGEWSETIWCNGKSTRFRKQISQSTLFRKNSM